MSAPRTARERVREEMTAEILAVARRHMAHEGAAALSLRSVARDLEMAPSALYRYFDGRDALLSALILGAYESLAAEAEQAAQTAAQLRRAATPSAGWPCPRAMRALGPGAPQRMGPDLRDPGAGLPGARADGRALRRPSPARWCAPSSMRGRPAGCTRRERSTVSAALAAAVVPVHEALFPGMPVGHGGAGARGLDDHRRRHQPRGLRALAQHGARPRRALRGHGA